MAIECSDGISVGFSDIDDIPDGISVSFSNFDDIPDGISVRFSEIDDIPDAISVRFSDTEEIPDSISVRFSGIDVRFKDAEGISVVSSDFDDDSDRSVAEITSSGGLTKCTDRGMLVRMIS